MVDVFMSNIFCDMQIYNTRLCVTVLLKSRKRGITTKETLSSDVFTTIVIGVHIYVNIITRSFWL
jgi:hypothetical protein